MGYYELNEGNLASWFGGQPDLCAHLGGSPSDWAIEENSDGNLNRIYLVRGPRGSFCVKQALPYIRAIGESWPLGLERAVFEIACLRRHGRAAFEFVPKLYHFDSELYAQVLELLSPHIVLRHGMIAAITYPDVVRHIALYVARAHFSTSSFSLPAVEKRELVKEFSGNHELCKATEDVIFTDPYIPHERNRWTRPYLDSLKSSFEKDVELKLSISRLKLCFMTATEVLLHGDFHTGSVMVTQDESKIIDGEFACVGPAAFDIGVMLGNFLMNFFAQSGLMQEKGEGADYCRRYQSWLLEGCARLWTVYAQEFSRLWRCSLGADAYPRVLFTDKASHAAWEAESDGYLRDVYTQSLGFAGAEMIRRTFGIAHNSDLESIQAPDLRAQCERRILIMAREMMVNSVCYETPVALATKAWALIAAEDRHADT